MSGQTLQQQYYERTAADYDNAHTEEEHVYALHILAGLIEFYGIKSILDVGAGTGRAMGWLRKRFPDLEIKGVEPVEALILQGHAKGIPATDLVLGDGAKLPFPDGSFDMVCEFAVLHHVKKPNVVIDEMSRVARKAICISDCNFMGQGPGWLRAVKLILYTVGLWPVADFFKTRGKGYTYSEEDGIAYSYSVIQSLKHLRKQWNNVRVLSTGGSSDTMGGLVLTSPHLLVVAAVKARAAGAMSSPPK